MSVWTWTDRQVRSYQTKCVKNELLVSAEVAEYQYREGYTLLDIWCFNFKAAYIFHIINLL